MTEITEISILIRCTGENKEDIDKTLGQIFTMINMENIIGVGIDVQK